MAVFTDRVAEVVKLFLHAVSFRGLEDITAGVELEGVAAMVGASCKIDQVDLGIEVPEVLTQQESVHFGHLGLQKGYIYHILSGRCERCQTALVTQDLRFRKKAGEVLFCLFQYGLVRIYKENSHYINPPACIFLNRWCSRCSLVM